MAFPIIFFCTSGLKGFTVFPNSPIIKLLGLLGYQLVTLPADDVHNGLGAYDLEDGVTNGGSEILSYSRDLLQNLTVFVLLSGFL